MLNTNKEIEQEKQELKNLINNLKNRKMKTSKVKSVTFVNSWENQQGETFYTHQYQMEDGTQINANHKQMNPFQVGETVDYEVKGNDPKGNPKGSVGKPKDNGFKGGFKQDNKDNGIITWLSCYSSTCTLFQQSTVVSFDTILERTNEAYQEALKHSTLNK